MIASATVCTVRPVSSERASPETTCSTFFISSR
jgi:hypothetical protein